MVGFKEFAGLMLRSLRRFISLSFILASMILIVRLYDLIITSNFTNYPPGSALHILSGIKFDLVLYLRISAILMIPFLIIAYFSQKAAKYFFIISSILFVFGEISWPTVYQLVNGHVSRNVIAVAMRARDHMSAPASKLC